MKKRPGMLLAVCLAIGLLLAGCSGNAGAPSGVESSQSESSGRSAASSDSEYEEYVGNLFVGQDPWGGTLAVEVKSISEGKASWTFIDASEGSTLYQDVTDTKIADGRAEFTLAGRDLENDDTFEYSGTLELKDGAVVMTFLSGAVATHSSEGGSSSRMAEALAGSGLSNSVTLYRSQTKPRSAQEGGASQGATSAASVGDNVSSANDDSAGANVDSSAGASPNSKASSSAMSANTASSNATSGVSASASIASSPKEKADDGLIDVYNLVGGAASSAEWIPRRVIYAEEWGDAAAEGDAASAWAYTQAIERIELEDLVGQMVRWPYGAHSEPVAGYAVDGQIVYANFGNVEGEVWMSGIFDKDGKVVYLRRCGNGSYGCYAFKDDVLISYAGGEGAIRVDRPKLIGEWDDGERLALQESLLDVAYSNFAKLRVDDMINVEQAPRIPREYLHDK